MLFGTWLHAFSQAFSLVPEILSDVLKSLTESERLALKVLQVHGAILRRQRKLPNVPPTLEHLLQKLIALV